MELDFHTNNLPCKLILRVRAHVPLNLAIKGYHPWHKNTIYFDRAGRVSGERAFILGMPRSPKKLNVSIYNKDLGNMPIATDFEILEKKLIPLTPHKFKENSMINTYLKFFGEFVEQAGFGSLGDYWSDDEKFKIEYVSEIVGDNGKPLNTPARIHKTLNHIQVSQKAFKNYTIPMRMFVGCHEFSHNYLNKNMDDEVEADMNGAYLYLSQGYPNIEAIYAFTKVFTDRDANWNRMHTLNEYVNDWDKREKYKMGITK